MSSSSSSISRMIWSRSQSTFRPNSNLSCILFEDVGEGLVGRAQQLHDVVVGLEDGAERHRDDGVLLHHRLVDALVGEDVLAGRVLNDHRRVRDDRGDVAVVDGVDLGPIRPDAELPEAQRAIRFDHAVDILAARWRRRPAAASPVPRAGAPPASGPARACRAPPGLPPACGRGARAAPRRTSRAAPVGAPGPWVSSASWPSICFIGEPCG